MAVQALPLRTLSFLLFSCVGSSDIETAMPERGEGDNSLSQVGLPATSPSIFTPHLSADGADNEVGGARVRPAGTRHPLVVDVVCGGIRAVFDARTTMVTLAHGQELSPIGGAPPSLGPQRRAARLTSHAAWPCRLCLGCRRPAPRRLRPA